METLDDLRKSIDNIDNAIVAMFAERFKVTDRVGQYKASNGLAARDQAREAAQFARIAQLAHEYGLDQTFAQSYLKSMLERVVERHIAIAQHQLP